GEVPRHPNEQPPVMAKVGRPPILRSRHQGMQVFDHRVQVETLEFLGVVEPLAHRIGRGGVLVEDLKVQLVRPPVTVRVCADPARERALAFTCHVVYDRVPHLVIAPQPDSRYQSDRTATRRDLSTVKRPPTPAIWGAGAPCQELELLQLM